VLPINHRDISLHFLNSSAPVLKPVCFFSGVPTGSPGKDHWNHYWLSTFLPSDSSEPSRVSMTRHGQYKGASYWTTATKRYRLLGLGDPHAIFFILISYMFWRVLPNHLTNSYRLQSLFSLPRAANGEHAIVTFPRKEGLSFRWPPSAIIWLTRACGWTDQPSCWFRRRNLVPRRGRYQLTAGVGVSAVGATMASYWTIMGYFLSFFFFPPLSSVKQVFKIMKLGEDLVTMAFRFRPHMFKPTAISYKREGEEDV